MKAFAGTKGKVSLVIGDTEHVITTDQAIELSLALRSAAQKWLPCIPNISPLFERVVRALHTMHDERLDVQTTATILCGIVEDERRRDERPVDVTHVVGRRGPVVSSPITARCNTCGVDYDFPGPHECMRVDGVVARWEPDPTHPGTHRLVAGRYTKEQALAAILPALQRCEEADRHRVVDALVALGAG
jgi:hypothetical protein